MSERPRSVTLVAQTHWVVGVIIGASIALLHVLTRRLPGIEFGPRTYAIAGSLAVLFFLTGTLVWFGRWPGRLLSRICGLLYLPRPQFGRQLWRAMDAPEFNAHFSREAKAPRLDTDRR